MACASLGVTSFPATIGITSFELPGARDAGVESDEGEQQLEPPHQLSLNRFGSRLKNMMGKPPKPTLSTIAR